MANAMPNKIHRGVDRRASVSVMAALSLTALIGCSALVIDVGLTFMQRTQLQAAGDAAALAGAANIAQAGTIASKLMAVNGFDADTTAQTVVGSYCPDPTIPAALRFSPGSTVVPGCGVPTGPLPNAVRVNAATQTPLILGRALSEQTTLHPSTISTAARIDAASLKIGSSLLTIDGGIENALLSNLLGTKISLSAVSYNGLVGAQVNALDFLDALAVKVGLSAGTYDQLLGTTVSVGDIIDAEITALSRSGGTSAAAAIAGLQLLKLQLPNPPDLNLSKLLDLGPWRTEKVGSPQPAALQASLNAYDLLTCSVQAANGSNFLGLQTAINIPGIANVSVVGTAIEPPVGSFFEFGPIGISAHTAQVRMQISISLLNVLQLLGTPALVSLPIYLEIGSGDATISNIACGPDPASDATVTVSAKSGLASVYIGTVDMNVMKNFSHPITAADIAPATIVNLIGLIQIVGSADINIGSSHYTDLLFNQQDIHNASAQTVSSKQITSTLFQSLLTGLQLSIATPLFNIPVPDITALLAPVFAVLPLDPLLDGIMAALGLQLGRMDVWVTGVRCRVPVLVQ